MNQETVEKMAVALYSFSIELKTRVERIKFDRSKGQFSRQKDTAGIESANEILRKAKRQNRMISRRFFWIPWSFRASKEEKQHAKEILEYTAKISAALKSMNLYDDPNNNSKCTTILVNVCQDFEKMLRSKGQEITTDEAKRYLLAQWGLSSPYPGTQTINERLVQIFISHWDVTLLMMESLEGITKNFFTLIIGNYEKVNAVFNPIAFKSTSTLVIELRDKSIPVFQMYWTFDHLTEDFIAQFNNLLLLVLKSCETRKEADAAVIALFSIYREMRWGTVHRYLFALEDKLILNLFMSAVNKVRTSSVFFVSYDAFFKMIFNTIKRNTARFNIDEYPFFNREDIYRLFLEHYSAIEQYSNGVEIETCTQMGAIYGSLCVQIRFLGTIYIDESISIPYITSLSNNMFKELLIPVMKAQGPASFVCLEGIAQVILANGVRSKQDVELIIFIVNKKGKAANDIFKNFLAPGLMSGIILHPLSRDGTMKSFITSSPIYTTELYALYISIIRGDFHPGEKEARLAQMFADLRQVRSEIVSGILTKKYSEQLVSACLYSVFAPEVSIDRKIYMQVYQSRQDRQSDIPSVLKRLSGKTVRISKGGFVVKGELNTDSWNHLIEAVIEVNKQPLKISPPELGMSLALEFRKSTLRERQKEFLRFVYAYDRQNGNILPNFQANYEILMKYKEFVGDRLKNDIIYSLLSVAQETFPEQFAKILGKSSVNFSKLAKMLFGLWRSSAEDKAARIQAILLREGISDPINWSPTITPEEISRWLSAHATNVIEKSLVQKIFNELYGDDYALMQKEMEKFEFKNEGISLFGEKFTFVLSKRHTHSVAMFNMGVCVAPDQKLWESQDMWQMIIFDKDGYAKGGVIYRTIYDDGKAYLIASIQPSGAILNDVSPDRLHDKIIQFSKLMVKTLNYQNLLIPKNTAINSNRGSIQSIISLKNYPTFNANQQHSFSYNPYAYSYQDFYIAA